MKRAMKLGLAGGPLLALLVGVSLVACSADDASDGGSGTISARGYADTPTSADGAAGDGDGDASINVGGNFEGFGGQGSFDPLPEEVEDDTLFRAPVATGKYLWSANPASGRVALIDVVDLSVQVLSAGLEPTFLASIPNSDDPAALVLNVGSSDATRFVVKDGEVTADDIETHVRANRWSIGSGGKWAVAWSRPEPGETLDPTEGLQEITVIRLRAAKMERTRITVGYRPSEVKVSDDGERVIVVSAEGITLIDLTGDEPEPSHWIELGIGDDNRDIALSAEGNFALVRQEGALTATVIDLRDPDQTQELGFSGRVTDVDLSATGRGVVVIRERSEVYSFDLEEVMVDPTDLDSVRVSGELFGSISLSGDGETAVVYTNAVENDRISIIDLEEGKSYLSYRTLSTQSPVFGVNLTPSGEYAVVMAAEDFLPASAFSVIELGEERFPRVVGTTAPVAQVALSDDFGIVTATADGVHEAHLISMGKLSVTRTPLATEPLAAGALTDLNTAFVAQSHPEGRVTFFNLAADQTKTLTGFELSAEVVDE